MKKFGVYYKTNVESFMIAEFDTLAEAKEYCTNETKGCIPVSEDDTRVDNHNISFYYEVYDGDPPGQGRGRGCDRTKGSRL